MERYTEKINETDYKLTKYNDIVRACARQKLGKIEDMLKAFNIETLEELEKLLEFATTYEELTNKLDCPLEVVFKALINGVYVIDEETKELQCILRGLYTFTGEGLGASAGFSDERVWRRKVNEAGTEFYPIYFWRDYKKTWFLKEDRSE